jgi:hypothetical protein
MTGSDQIGRCNILLFTAARIKFKYRHCLLSFPFGETADKEPGILAAGSEGEDY